MPWPPDELIKERERKNRKYPTQVISIMMNAYMPKMYVLDHQTTGNQRPTGYLDIIGGRR